MWKGSICYAGAIYYAPRSIPSEKKSFENCDFWSYIMYGINANQILTVTILKNIYIGNLYGKISKIFKVPKINFSRRQSIANDERRSEMVLLSKMTHWFVISKSGQSGKMRIIQGFIQEKSTFSKMLHFQFFQRQSTGNGLGTPKLPSELKMSDYFDFYSRVILHISYPYLIPYKYGY